MDEPGRWLPFLHRGPAGRGARPVRSGGSGRRQEPLAGALVYHPAQHGAPAALRRGHGGDQFPGRGGRDGGAERLPLHQLRHPYHHQPSERLRHHPPGYGLRLRHRGAAVLPDAVHQQSGAKDAGKGAGLGNSFLSFVSESEALLHVIRVFKNSAVPHPENSINPLRDWKIVEAELIYRDLGVISNRISRLEEKKNKKKLTPQEISEFDLIKKLESHLLNELPLREFNLTDEEKRMLSGFAFLTLKPELIVLNLDDTQTGEVPEISELESEMSKKNLKCVKVFGSTEMELEQLSPEDREEFMKDLSITEPGRERLIHEAYKLLGLISFFTSGNDEVRAWTLKSGSNAVDAAGTIHSDLARGFIRAQVVAYDDFVANNCSIAQCREKGVLRLEGKEYIVKDGDMIEIRFNV